MNEGKKAWKPDSSFPKVRARTKRREGHAVPAASVSVRSDLPFTVVERRAGSAKGVVAYHVITRGSRGNARKKSAGDEADVSLLGQIDFRKRKRGK